MEMLVFEDKGKPEYLKENLSEKEENQQQTQPTYAGLRRRDLNPGHIDGRRVLSPLHCPCYPWSKGTEEAK